MRFSERYGYKPARAALQIDSMDDALRNGLWSLLQNYVWTKGRTTSSVYGTIGLSSGENPSLWALSRSLWLDFFKKPVDTLKYDWREVLRELREFFFKASWHDVYDFVEFVVGAYPANGFRDNFCSDCNRILEREMSAYRFVDGILTRIVDEVEIDEIEEAAKASNGPVVQHLRRSLELMSDRSNPDYRNSVKESISAVESLVIATAGKRGTLGDLLKRLDNVGLHPALKSAFGSLYGYTSDESGVRHALLEKDRVEFEDAKFMLVVCSAFVNFVNGKRTPETKTSSSRSA